MKFKPEFRRRRRLLPAALRASVALEMQFIKRQQLVKRTQQAK
jgi:hypothetical protein